MKKLILASLLAGFSINAWADTPQVSLVKRIYQEAKRSDDDTAILKRYGDASLRSALNKAEQSEFICLEASPIWNSQDPNKNARVTFSSAGANKVRAKIAGHGSVIYTLACSGGRCRVKDVATGGQSLKRTVAACE